MKTNITTASLSDLAQSAGRWVVVYRYHGHYKAPELMICSPAGTTNRYAHHANLWRRHDPNNSRPYGDFSARSEINWRLQEAGASTSALFAGEELRTRDQDPAHVSGSGFDAQITRAGILIELSRNARMEDVLQAIQGHFDEAPHA